MKKVICVALLVSSPVFGMEVGCDILSDECTRQHAEDRTNYLRVDDSVLRQRELQIMQQIRNRELDLEEARLRMQFYQQERSYVDEP